MLGNFLPNVPHGALVVPKGTPSRHIPLLSADFLFFRDFSELNRHAKNRRGAFVQRHDRKIIYKQILDDILSTRFDFCFPSGNGNMVCRHHNGRWIVFPIYWEKENRPIRKEKDDLRTDDKE
ncbi:MAG: hypothetical protein A3C08_01675 [Candidatus Taylorbacteria bacterium RIFCSPHIGHO2_02_FULL_47_18]|uniref:Uncharacterized protein n=1 Tax=Candidatus Taylorbacteria bacterium RIFCSPLOWO2_01_FULL_48_100 TaxID=1802322 RepID=A0A1G2NFU8_9BACT|nr:MAG: hypothetical protein A2670_01315 [Candidatus Taylorbacteria bacterium RIFCSPHIGHO2_01_FULL_48_38]OHA28460.1 MAG: hypothetical protein A3C08_01675 [Candidatus Taylorbacteria bacterium RIFCSPHIGHO2_02_FULL_47_18]OHA34936.1 MAG: hypothetical protein A2938_02215 [Candidatus Taylorbacteria bacterium RIFCSPLOWO2_01_FULL_48_100]OHA40215.1 MAG: hypothetical protein A3J31_01385 [Candidatus Taylorbacteria bacterium RIFCSPLOWO2_02_FULL_48_16]OHA45451.1 MAG: hypothetical protein A3H13_01460 [Candid